MSAVTTAAGTADGVRAAAPLDRAPLRRTRNREGQWAWALHRVSGLGLLAFLCLHVVDTSLMLQGEAAYNHLIRGVYQQWWFQPAEVALGGALVYHTLNGLRVVALDLWEDGIRHDRLLRRVVAGAFVLTMAPLAAVMLLPFITGAGR